MNVFDEFEQHENESENCSKIRALYFHVLFKFVKYIHQKSIYSIKYCNRDDYAVRKAQIRNRKHDP